jgi:hypothetical protein
MLSAALRMADNNTEMRAWFTPLLSNPGRNVDTYIKALFSGKNYAVSEKNKKKNYIKRLSEFEILEKMLD